MTMEVEKKYNFRKRELKLVVTEEEEEEETIQEEEEIIFVLEIVRYFLKYNNLIYFLKYNIIYTDPPWKYDNSIFPTGDVDDQYETMQLEDLKQLKWMDKIQWIIS